MTEGLEITRLLGDKEGIATAQTILATSTGASMYELAREQLESVRVSDEIGFDYVSSDALLSLALIAEAEGNPSEAVGSPPRRRNVEKRPIRR